MIHKMLFKKTEFKIKVFPYKNNEQYIDKGEEFLSSSFDTYFFIINLDYNNLKIKQPKTQD